MFLVLSGEGDWWGRGGGDDVRMAVLELVVAATMAANFVMVISSKGSDGGRGGGCKATKLRRKEAS